jgi:hypothetical protein
MLRRACLIPCLVVLAAACSSGEKQADTPPVSAAPTTTTPPNPTTTTTIPLFSFDNSVPPPDLNNTGTDYEAIAQSLLAYEAWVAAHHPDPELLSAVVAPGSRHAESQQHDAGLLQKNRRRFFEEVEGAPTVEIVESGDDRVSIRYRQKLRRQVVIDPAGQVIDEKVRTDETTEYLVLLVKVNEQWHLASVVEHKASTTQ